MAVSLFLAELKIWRFEMRKKRNISSFRRKKDFRPLRITFLIVCEGERTEPHYFESFRVPKDVCRVIGVGMNTVSLVEKTIALKEDGDYGAVWCVFDRDSFPSQNFNNAILLAEHHNIDVAYSNEAFEIWYLLHFHYHDAATGREQYKGMLTQRFGIPYKKNDKSVYERLLSRQEDAIKNAERLLDSYPNHSPVNDNPSTTVHKLVQELNKYSV